jgi:hypothetical protein
VKCVWYQVVSESAFLSFYLFIPRNNARNVPAVVSDFFKDEEELFFDFQFG